ncbi:MAG TPA: alpha/beta hydrolase [Gemmatimonadales bacterium]|nr:alpha/beta hydrolase [Gemmatimonadales bacterium]
MQRRQFLELMFGSSAALTVSRRWATRLSALVESQGAPLDAAAYAASRRFAETTSGRIAYVERGSGDAVLFLHGFPLNGFQWRGAIDRLSPVRRCIAPDFLAMGYTEVAEGASVGPAAQAAMIVQLMDALSLAAVDLVANDSGGAVAQLLVAGHPARFRSLLLTNCDTEHDSPPPALLPVIELSKSGKYVDEWLVPWLADKVLARSARGIGGMCYADPAHPTDEAIEYYFAPLVSSARRKALVHAYALALEHNSLLGIEAALQRSTVPTRILWGTADTIFSSASPDYLARTFGASRGVRRLPGQKLFFPEELPDVIATEARGLWGVGQ